VPLPGGGARPRAHRPPPLHVHETSRKQVLPSVGGREASEQPREFSVVNVELVRWPSQRERRERLRLAGSPRLLLVENETPAPVVTDPMEDWVRLPVDRSDLQARVQGILARAERADWGMPRLDEWGVLRFGGRQVTLPPLEARLARVLVEQFRSVILRDDLTKAGWPAEAPGRNALDVHILRLRRRIESLGLSVRTVRSRGYLLESPSVSVQVAAADS